MVIDEGEMVAIRGPSGSGKSTLMNILGCLDRPDTGRISWPGRMFRACRKNALAEVRNRRIGFIFQNFNLLPRMSALENVELPLHYAARHDAVQRGAEALADRGACRTGRTTSRTNFPAGSGNALRSRGRW